MRGKGKIMRDPITAVDVDISGNDTQSLYFLSVTLFLLRLCRYTDISVSYNSWCYHPGDKTHSVNPDKPCVRSLRD